tara:strand:- start:20 stop:457 length:438 start_codon:yes stop_codon:yes gene_type:complete
MPNLFYKADIFSDELKKFYSGKFEDVQRNRSRKAVSVRENMFTTCDGFCAEYEALCLEYWNSRTRTETNGKEIEAIMASQMTKEKLTSLVRTRKKTFEEKYLAMWEIHGKALKHKEPLFGSFKRAGLESPNTQDAYTELKKKMGF